ncbi:HsdM family class I SAM-dependent methyltransferase [Photobacterium toruni]|uniref:site-specific DNA-methyltransferase (adenine-specific) n=1 Tax=Photobacterium toruni TaxID=1935446 RepID=A0A1T4T6Z9_9GAMM|nr:N-6 DNA methylase [Photobacterium toruni]SKA35938.1 Type I restriction enzyme EcoKI M protein [Photobacterium toruni]
MEKISKNKKIGDFYWAHADILRGIGINESVYDQRILAFMALKLLIDNHKLKFNFDYKNQFGLEPDMYHKYAGENSKQTLINLIDNIGEQGKNLKFFDQQPKYNPDAMTRNVLEFINYKRTFSLVNYIEEVEPHYLEMILDIYQEKADFTDYPKDKYKDLYEVTIARMKKLSGDLTGQHFTQQSIIHLMCASVLEDMKKSRSKVLAIYDPACGTGSMLMEAADYFAHHTNKPIQVYGQEYHGQTWFLAKVFLEISDIENTIAYGNTLTNPAFDKINGKDSFDFIIANPPFGVDWKHDYDEVISNMALEENSNYLVVKNAKDKIVTPKKSDGQFLFMMHILKLLQVSKKSHKRAKAAIVTNSTLASTGKQGGAEANIRQAIFKLNNLVALLEQPNAMFTNTSISSHIWFFDNQHKSSQAQLLKAQTDEYSMFVPHPQPKDKMKNAYSKLNIEQLLSYFKNDADYISKSVDTKKMHELNVSQLIGHKAVVADLSLAELFNNIEQELNALCDLKGNLYEIR